MSAWTKFATKFFHQKQKQNPDYKFSQALKQASPLFKKMKKGGSSKKQRGGNDNVKYIIENNSITPSTDVNNSSMSLDGIKLIIDGMDDGDENKKELLTQYETLKNSTATNTNTNETVDTNPNTNTETDTNPNTNNTQMLYKVDDQGNITDEPCDSTSDEYNDNEKCKPKPATGGKKSQKKAKKGSKKSQKKSKKAKKAGSKKSKK